jgi:hypothetical protein
MGSRRRDPTLTLGYLADNGYELAVHCTGYELAVHCTGCDRNARVAVIPLAKRFGYFASMYQAAARLKCGRCGRKGVEAERIKWSDGIQFVDRDRFAR